MMSGAMNDSKENLQQPEDDESLQYWMWCEEEDKKKNGVDKKTGAAPKILFVNRENEYF